MYTFTKKMIRSLLALIITVGGLALTGSLASAAAVPIELCAVAGTATLTGSFTVPIWGFGIPTTPGDCTTATASLPGPVLSVNEGDVVTITLENALPAGHTLNFEIPGVSFNPGLTDGSAPIVFTASAPGTYLYQSGGDAGRQEAMGLYGALIVRPTSAPDTPIPGQAYHPASTAYDVEATLVLSQVDPNFNNCATDSSSPCLSDPNNFNMYTYRATYWLINGKAYPDTAPGITATVGSKVLLRYLNAGYDNTSMMLLGMHEQVLARDAYLLNNPFLADAETIPAGGTEDAIATVPSYSSAYSANGFALYNRQLHDGMLTFIHP
jgi:FtsP/CotA-like multicopper oxidase with cupredoxin domain